MQALHHCKIVHLDVKPANILFNDILHRAVLCDFSLSIHVGGTDKSVSTVPASVSNLCTERYRPPELIVPDSYHLPPQNLVTRGVDVFSLAVVYWEIAVRAQGATRATPLFPKGDKDVVDYKKERDARKEQWKDCYWYSRIKRAGARTLKLLMKMLDPDFSLRVGFAHEVGDLNIVLD